MYRKKIVSMVLVICMVLAMMPSFAVANTPVETVKMGYYDENGEWQEGNLPTQTLPDGIHSVNKTAVKDANNPNMYEITLEVVTKQTETMTPPDSAATVLVIDTSGSMEDNRLASAKAAAIDFVNSYSGDTPGAGRFLAVVNFATGVNTALSWIDVSTTSGKNAAIDAIKSLRANGGTNLHAGLKEANVLLGNNTVSAIPKEAKNVVALTDGAPTYYLEVCPGTSREHSHRKTKTVSIDGETYDISGTGKSGSSTINIATANEAASLRSIANVFTVCYGAKDDYTYIEYFLGIISGYGPKVGDFLANSIASAGNAYNADNAGELSSAFEAISETIVSGLDGSGMTVDDTPVDFVTVSGLPAGMESGGNGFTWELSEPTSWTEGNTTYYKYTLTYNVTLDVNNEAFDEKKWYPLNGETYLNIPNEDGSSTKVAFPIPAGQGVKSRYTVTWVNDDDTQLELDENVPYGTTPSYDGETPTKAATAEFTYTFAGWDPEVSPVTGDVTYKATYTSTTNEYTVTWVNDDDTQLELDENVPYGTTPSYDGAEPTKAATAEFTYTFAGWDPEVSPVTGDVTYKATYTSTTNEYTVTWVNDDDTQLELDENVPYGTMPSYDGETPTKAATAEFTYTFAGWDPEVSPVTGDVTYKATYTSTTNEYTVTWVNDDDTQLELDENVPYGTTPSYDGETPTKAATAEFTYTFAGWDPEVSPVTGDITYTAQYEVTTNEYTVTWVNDDDTQLELDENVPYGTMPSYDGAEPTKAATAEFTYTFAGWDPEVSPVTGDVTYKATYTSTTNEYTVTYIYGWDGEAFANQIYDSIPYGEKTPEFVGTPTLKGCEFLGWAPQIAETVTGNVTYAAQWKEVGEVLPFDGDNPDKDSDNDKEEKKKDDSVNTGDDTNTLPWIALLISSALSCGYVLTRKRREEEAK